MPDEFIMLRKVRISFPHLKKRPVINGEEGKYGAVLLLDKDQHAEEIAACEEAIADGASKLKLKKMSSDKRFLRDGDESNRAEYEGCMTVNANSDTPIEVIAKNGKDFEEGDGGIYAGCYVDAKIRPWAQNNNYGKKVNANLIAVRFAAEGEAFSGAHVSDEDRTEGFGEVEEDDAFFDEEAA